MSRDMDCVLLTHHGETIAVQPDFICYLVDRPETDNVQIIPRVGNVLNISRAAAGVADLLAVMRARHEKTRQRYGLEANDASDMDRS